MQILLCLLLCFSAWALEPFEKIPNVKIVRVLPNNIILLNRGLEDGLIKNDHIKISNDVSGFSSRAICLRATQSLSYWKLYRVPNAEAFSLDFVYTISGMSDKEIPMPVASLRDHEQTIDDPTEKKIVTETGPNPFAVKRDLPEKLTERDLIEATSLEKRKLFLEEAINQDQLKRDLSEYRVSVFASPFMRQSINNGESLRYGFRGANVASRYRLLTQFEQQQTKLEDPVTKEAVSTRSTRGNAQFSIHHLTPSTSSLSLINYNSQRFSSLATPKYHWQVGPIGFTWHVFESKSWEYLDLSYIPLYDIRMTEYLNTSGAKRTQKTNGLRHGFRMAFRRRINERVALENLLWVRPFQDLASWDVDTSNLNLENDFKLVFSLTDNLFFDYNFIYQKDKLWRTISGLPEDNLINSLNVRYDFDL